MAIAFAQKTAKFTSSGASSITSASLTTTAGNALVCTVSSWHASTPAHTISLSTGFAVDVSVADSAATASSRATIGARLNIAGGSMSVTVTSNMSSTAFEGNLAEFSGLATSSALDKTASDPHGTNTTSVTPTTAATTQASELVVACVSDSASDATCNISDPPTGYTSIGVNQDANATIGYEGAYKIVSSTGAQSATWSMDTGNDGAVGVIATYKAATATTHTSTGALTGPGSTIAGTSVHKTKHTTSGILTGAGSTVVGTSVHKTKHTTSGALTGPGSTVAGVAQHRHVTTGALIGVGSTVVGTSVHKTKHTTSGILTGQGSTVVGVAKRFRAHPTSGVLTGGGSTLAGTSVHTSPGVHAASGALIGVGALLSGIATLISKAQPPRQDEGGGRRKSFRYDRWGRKKRQAFKRSPEAVQIVEQIAEEYVEAPDYSWLTKAIQALEAQLSAEHIKAAQVYVELLELERDRLAHEADEDDELLLS